MTKNQMILEISLAGLSEEVLMLTGEIPLQYGVSVHDVKGTACINILMIEKYLNEAKELVK